VKQASFVRRRLRAAEFKKQKKSKKVNSSNIKGLRLKIYLIYFKKSILFNFLYIFFKFKQKINLIIKWLYNIINSDSIYYKKDNIDVKEGSFGPILKEGLKLSGRVFLRKESEA
jgi:hypothetical protein